MLRINLLNTCYSLSSFHRCLQGLNVKQVKELVLDILKVRWDVNRGGGRLHVPLSKNAKAALANNKISRTFITNLRTKYPELKLTAPQKVDVNRGLNVTREMVEEYLNDLACEINHCGIGNLEHVLMVLV